MFLEEIGPRLLKIAEGFVAAVAKSTAYTFLVLIDTDLCF